MMAKEIERKFQVKGDFKDQAGNIFHIRQGYLSSEPGRTVRIRIKGENGYITVKGQANASGISRYEWEMDIPIADAIELLKLCEPGVIDKTRYEIHYGRHTFEVDEFHGDNEGLIIAEVELASEEEIFERPVWLGEEVSGDRRFYNSSLISNPYSRW